MLPPKKQLMSDTEYIFSFKVKAKILGGNIELFQANFVIKYKTYYVNMTRIFPLGMNLNCYHKIMAFIQHAQTISRSTSVLPLQPKSIYKIFPRKLY